MCSGSFRQLWVSWLTARCISHVAVPILYRRHTICWLVQLHNDPINCVGYACVLLCPNFCANNTRHYVPTAWIIYCQASHFRHVHEHGTQIYCLYLLHVDLLHVDLYKSIALTFCAGCKFWHFTLDGNRYSRNLKWHFKFPFLCTCRWNWYWVGIHMYCSRVTCVFPFLNYWPM